MGQTLSCSPIESTSPIRTHRLAVLIPAFNEEEPLGKTLESVIKAGIPLKDIYVVDDGSTDQTVNMASAYGINVIRSKMNMGKAKSLKRLLFSQNITERYDLIAFLDADTTVDPQYFFPDFISSPSPTGCDALCRPGQESKA
jgi:glycosyltransferase involved in cell wall biosynthesis